MEGGFIHYRSFSGIVADWQMYDTAWTKEQIHAFTHCQHVKLDFDPLLSFRTTMNKFIVEGSTVIMDIPASKVCVPPEGYFILLPDKRNFQKAVNFCGTMNGSLILPENREDNAKVWKWAVRYSKQCEDDWSTISFFNIVGNLETLKWVTYINQSQEIKWDNFTGSYDLVSKSLQCVSLGGKNYQYAWFGTPCWQTICPICNFTNIPKLQVRGLCKDSLMDRFVFLRGETNNNLKLDGASLTTMFWDGNDWIVTNRKHVDFKMIMEIKSIPDFPFGVHTWKFFGDVCGVDEVN